MGYIIPFIFILSILINYFYTKKQKAQLAYITAYKFNASIRKKITEKYTHLSDGDIDKVFESLTDFFYFCNQANKRMVSMPSQVVDVAWHEFILFTKEYEAFSEKAFGRFLHHTPTEAMDSKTKAQDGIKRAWRLACSREEVNPKEPEYLPRLFAINGFIKN